MILLIDSVYLAFLVIFTYFLQFHRPKIKLHGVAVHFYDCSAHKIQSSNADLQLVPSGTSHGLTQELPRSICSIFPLRHTTCAFGLRSETLGTHSYACRDQRTHVPHMPDSS